jgi:uncharacterized protein
MPQVRNALVTGASSGIGRELVRQLVRDRGMTVLASARRLDRLESLAAELPPGRVQIAVGDLADPTFRQKLWEQAEAMPGGLDLLVNNAGLGSYAELETQGPDAIRQIIEVNLVALIDLTQKAIRYMRNRRTGQVLQMSSVLGFIGLRDSAVYVASKHAVNGLVKSLAYELRDTGVRVWAACPGRTESEFRTVALGDHASEATSSSHGEPVAKVVRTIVRGIEGRSTFLMPSWSAWAIVTLAHWLPGPFDFVMSRWTPSSYKDALAGVKAAAARESNRTK